MKGNTVSKEEEFNLFWVLGDSIEAVDMGVLELRGARRVKVRNVMLWSSVLGNTKIERYLDRDQVREGITYYTPILIGNCFLATAS